MSDTLALPTVVSFLDTFTHIHREIAWTRFQREDGSLDPLGSKFRDRLFDASHSWPLEIVLSPLMVGVRTTIHSRFGLPAARTTITAELPKREVRSTADMQERCRHASHELCNALKRVYSPESTERVSYLKSATERAAGAVEAGRSALMDALRQQLRRAVYLQTGFFRLDLHPDRIHFPHEQGAWWIQPIKVEEPA